MLLQYGQLARPSHERWQCSAGRPEDARGRQQGGGSGAWTGRGLEQGAVVWRQGQSRGQQLHGVLAGRTPSPPLEVGDGPHAQAGSLGQFLLRQTGGRTVALEQIAKSRRNSIWHPRRGHTTCPSARRATAPAAVDPAAPGAIIARRTATFYPARPIA